MITLSDLLWRDREVENEEIVDDPNRFMAMQCTQITACCGEVVSGIGSNNCS